MSDAQDPGCPDHVLHQLLEEFTDKLHAGSSPSPEDYVHRCPPGQAEKFRAMLRLLVEFDGERRSPRGSPPPRALPQQLGDFRILREIGRGGMGVVYEAEQISLGRRVAVKVLPALAPHRRERFRREEQTIARLHHTNIVPVYIADEVQDHCFFAMQLIEGGTTLDRALPALASGARAATRLRILDAIRQAADALAFTHEQGVLHLDIKPANLLWQKNGLVWVTDFGLAGLLEEDPNQALPANYQPGGTKGYIAPERYRGQTTERSDIYSLGITLYELLVRSSAGSPEEAEALAARVKGGNPPRPRQLPCLRDLDRDIEAVVCKATAPNPEERYASASALADDLRQLLKGAPVKARPRPRREKVRRWTQSHPWLALTAIVIGLQAVLASWEWARAEVANTNLVATGYVQTINIAERECKENHLEQARERLVALPRDLRGWDFDFLMRRCQRTPLRLTGHQGGIRALAFNPDGKTLASGSNDGTIRLWDIRTGEKVRELAGQVGGARSLSFSADGQLLASANDSRLVLIHATDTGEVRWRLPDTSASIALSPDGKLLAGDTADGRAQLRDLHTGAVRILGGPCPDVKGVCFSPDGSLLAAASKKNIRVWEVNGGHELVIERDTDVLGNSNASFSPDGRWLCGTADNASRVGVWDSHTGEQRSAFRITAPDWSNVASLTFGRNDEVALADGSGNVMVRDAGSGKTLESLFNDGRKSPASVALAPDGRYLAWSRGAEVLLLDRRPPTSQVEVVLRGTGRPIEAVAWSGDGERVLFGSSDKAARRCTYTVGDARTGAVLHTWSVPGQAVVGVGFAPDGRILTIDRVAGSTVTIRAWAGDSFQEVQPLQSPPTDVAAAFSPEGTLALLSAGKVARLCDLATGQEVRCLAGHDNTLSVVAFSASGRRAVTAGYDRTACVWDLASGARLSTFKGHRDRLLGACFSADGRWVATASCDGTVRIWSAEGGREERVLSEHLGEALSVAFTPDGQSTRLTSGGVRMFRDWLAGKNTAAHPTRLASGGGDGTVKVWDVGTGLRLLTLEGHRGEVNHVAFSPDGRRLLSAGEDGTVRIWDATGGPGS